MSKKFPGLYEIQELQGTKTSAAPHDAAYQKNFSISGTSGSFQVPPLRTKPVSTYEDEPSSNGKSFPLQQSPLKTQVVSKRKHDDEDEGVDLTSSEGDDDDDDADEEKQDSAEDNDEETSEDGEQQAEDQKNLLEKSKKALSEGKKNGVVLAHRIKKSERAVRPKDLRDLSGSSNDADDDDDDDDDEECDENLHAEQPALTPIEEFLGTKTMEKLKKRIKQRNSGFVGFDDDAIWALNEIVTNALTPKNSLAAMRIVGNTNEAASSKKEKLRQAAALVQCSPKKYAVPDGFLGTQYHAAALAVKYDLLFAVVVKPTGSSESICAMLLYPFGEANLKEFATAAAEQRLFFKSHTVPPVTAPRFAVFKGPTTQTKASIQMLVDESSSKVPEGLEGVQPRQQPSATTSQSSFHAAVTTMNSEPMGREPFVVDTWEDGEIILKASDKKLIVNDVKKYIRIANVNMVVVPNDVFAALYRYRTAWRQNLIIISQKLYDEDEASFCFYLKLASGQMNDAAKNAIARYLSTGKMLAQQIDFAFAHILFSFIRMDAQFNDYEEGRNKCVIYNMLVRNSSRMGTDTYSAISLSEDEVPLRSLLRLNQHVASLLAELWKQYLHYIGVAEGDKKQFFLRRQQYNQNALVRTVVSELLNTDYAQRNRYVDSQLQPMLNKKEVRYCSDDVVVFEALIVAFGQLFPSI